jgi:rubrerythrin
MEAEYKCLKCGYKYLSEPGPTQCPKCGHLYVKWLNFEEMHKMWVEGGAYNNADTKL